VEDRLGLTSVTGLLAVITTLSLGEKRSFSCLVLGDLVLGVLLAVLALAVGSAGLGYVDLRVRSQHSHIMGWFSFPFGVRRLTRKCATQSA